MHSGASVVFHVGFQNTCKNWVYPEYFVSGTIMVPSNSDEQGVYAVYILVTLARDGGVWCGSKHFTPTPEVQADRYV